MAEHLDGERDVFADKKQAYAGKCRLQSLLIQSLIVMLCIEVWWNFYQRQFGISKTKPALARIADAHELDKGQSQEQNIKGKWSQSQKWNSQFQVDNWEGSELQFHTPLRKNGRTVFKPPIEVVQMLFLPPIIIGQRVRLWV